MCDCTLRHHPPRPRTGHLLGNDPVPDANSENYSVTISCEMITVASYTDDAILAKVETWADSVPALAGSRTGGDLNRAKRPPGLFTFFLSV